MDFELSDEERAFQEAVRRFGDRVLRPAEPGDRPRGAGADPLRCDPLDGGGLGLLAIPVSSEYGGMGASAVLTEIAAEEIGARRPFDGDGGVLPARSRLGMAPRASWSRRAAAQRATERVPGGDVPGIAATTEPGGGSDLARMRTEARTTPEGFVLKGEKTFVSGTAEAASMGGGHLTLARDSGGQGFHFLYVPTRSPGLSTHRFENMGRMGISTGSLAYDDVRVPAGI